MSRSLKQSFFRLLRITPALTLLALAIGPHALQAQALPTAIGPGTYISLGGGISAFPSDYDRRTIGGGVIFMDVQPTFRYGFEGETRFLRYRTDEGVNQTNYLAGIHIGIRPQRFRPYVKFLVGATKIQAPFGYGQGTFFTFAPGGGVDYVLNDRWTARVVDLEYQIVPQFIGSNVRNLGVTMGLSYRLNGLSVLPRGTALRR
jgi:opacity protein-like surface antigen